MLFVQKKPFCSLPFEKIKVTCEGDLTFCCYQSKRWLGNLLQTSLEEIWFSRKADAIREIILSKKLPNVCKCPGCPFNYDLSIPKNTEKPPGEYWHRGWPIHLELDLPNTHCNVGGERPTKQNPACIMCERHTGFGPQLDRLEEVCATLRPYMKHLRTVHIQGIAEPFWKDKIFEVVDWLNITHDKHLSTITNGTILSPERRKKFLDFPRSQMIFSLDASTAETYVKIRRLNLFHKVVENLNAYSQERKPGQTLVLTNNINILNVAEAADIVKIAKEANVDVLEFNPTTSAPQIEVNRDTCHLFKEAQEKIVALSTELGVNLRILRNLYLNF